MNRIKLQGIINTRDLGGIVTKYGIIKEKKLLRGPALDTLTYEDIQYLKKEYKLATIIDLRTTQEVKERADVEIADVQNFHMPIFDERFPGISHEKQEDYDRAFDNFEVSLPKLYREVLNGQYLENISSIVRCIVTLPEDKYPVLFHCTAGKDRTGIIATILLLLLGANKKDIIKDYLYTNRTGKFNSMKRYLKIRLVERNKIKAKNITNIFVAKLEYINQVFDVIENDWNGIDDFAENGLKLTKDEIEEFRRKMLN